MSEAGYEGATIQAVASKAGLTPGLVHYHFKSKQEILLNVITMIEEIVKQRYKARTSADPFKDLAAYIDSFLALGYDADLKAVGCWVVIGAEALRQTEVREAYQAAAMRQLAILEAIIERCLNASGKSTQKKRSITLGTYAAIEGAFRLVVAAPTLVEAGFAASTVLSMAKGAIANTK